MALSAGGTGLIRRRAGFIGWRTGFIGWRNKTVWRRRVTRRRKAPQSKWSCMDRPNLRNLLVQMDDGPMDRLCYVNLDRPNGRRSNGPPMLRQFGPSKWTTVQWTVRVTSIWTVYITVIWTVQNYGCGPSFWTVQKYDCGP